MAPQVSAAIDDAIFHALEPAVGDLAFRLTDQVIRALVAHGEQMTRIGRRFYDDTLKGSPVLMIPMEPS